MIVVSACFGIEARWIARTAGVRVVKTPMGARATEALSEWDGRLGAGDLLVSSGFCGGLAAGLQTGDVVLADRIRWRGRDVALDPALLERARRVLGDASHVGLCAVRDEVVETREEKRRLAETGAIAVDMESGSLADWAAEQGVGFLVLRAVLDPVDLAVSIPGASAGSVLRHPIGAMRLGRRAARAGRAVGDAV